MRNIDTGTLNKIRNKDCPINFKLKVSSKNNAK